MDKKILELIRDAAQGNQNSLLKLRDIYRPLIDSCVHHYVSFDMTVQDIEDLSQEALIHFFGAVCSYDTRFENVEFGLYAKICIENRLVSFIRLHHRQNKVISVPLDNNIGGLGDGGHSDPLQTLIDRERMAALIDKVKKELSSYENKIWWMYVSGMTVSEIAAVLNVGSRSVSNAIYRIRQKLKKSINV